MTPNCPPKIHKLVFKNSLTLQKVFTTGSLQLKFEPIYKYLQIVRKYLCCRKGGTPAVRNTTVALEEKMEAVILANCIFRVAPLCKCKAMRSQKTRARIRGTGYKGEFRYHL